jgi:hypothetical protein
MVLTFPGEMALIQPAKAVPAGQHGERQVRQRDTPPAMGMRGDFAHALRLVPTVS